MQNTKATRSIPFVAGKSLNKSHNIGVRIQQTKSLMINTQYNRRKNMSLNSNQSSVHNNMCPVLQKLANPLQYKKECQEIAEIMDNGNNSQPKSTADIWAEYMIKLEEKKITRVTCTCPTRTTSNKKNTANKNNCNRRLGIYDEARKVMEDCQTVLNTKEEEFDRYNLYEDVTRPINTNKSTRMVNYMQKLKHIQDRLVG